SLKLRPARQDDAELLLRWRNDPTARSQFFDPGEVDPGMHARWLAHKLSGYDSRIYVAELDGQPVGQARVDRREGATGEISVSVDASARRRGIGRTLISGATARASAELGLATVVATVKNDN